MYFGAIIKKLEKIRALDQNQMLDEILADDYVQRLIVDLNQNQLWEEGEQADGSSTGDYSLNTIRLKLAYGDARQTPGRIDHITGLQSGQMFKSMKVEVIPEGFKVVADDRGSFFIVEPKALGLTEESLKKLRPDILIRLREKIR